MTLPKLILCIMRSQPICVHFSVPVPHRRKSTLYLLKICRWCFLLNSEHIGEMHRRIFHSFLHLPAFFLSTCHPNKGGATRCMQLGLTAKSSNYQGSRLEEERWKGRGYRSRGQRQGINSYISPQPGSLHGLVLFIFHDEPSLLSLLADLSK